MRFHRDSWRLRARAPVSPWRITRRDFFKVGALALGSTALSQCLGRCSEDSGEVKFWYSYGGRTREVVEELIEQFNDTHSDIKVSGSFQGDMYHSINAVL